MTTYRTREVELAVDTATGDQTVHTPWGIVVIHKGDMMVRFGANTVPVPGELWRQWFEDATPRPAEPEPEPVPFPETETGLSELTRAKLHELAQQRYGVELNDGKRKSQLVEDVRRLEAERKEPA